MGDSMFFPSKVHVGLQDYDRHVLEGVIGSEYIGPEVILVEELQKAADGVWLPVGHVRLTIYVYAVWPNVLTILKNIAYWVRRPDGQDGSGDWKRVERLRGLVRGKDV